MLDDASVYLFFHRRVPYLYLQSAYRRGWGGTFPVPRRIQYYILDDDGHTRYWLSDALPEPDCIPPPVHSLGNCSGCYPNRCCSVRYTVPDCGTFPDTPAPTFSNWNLHSNSI